MHEMTKYFSVSDLVARLGGRAYGADERVNRVASLEGAQAGSISFLANPKLNKLLETTQASVLIVRPGMAQGLSIACIEADDPYLYFTRVSQLFNPLPQPKAGIHPSAVIAADAVIDASVEIGPHAVVESGAIIGAGTIVQAGCVIGERVNLGSNCILYPRVVIYHHCQLGDRVIVHAGTVIGSDGFGNAWARDHWEKIPQSGRVIIGNDVEIGANTVIDRGAMEDTLIGNDVRMDNLIQIAHNVEIGQHTAVAACVGVAGSTKIGAGCLIGGAAMISGHLTITDRVSLSGGCGVTSDITESGTYGSVNPAVPITQWRKNAVHYRHLDTLVRRVKALEKKLKLENKESSDNE